MLEMISLEEAQKIVLEKTSMLGTENVSIINALNRILAEDIYSEVDVPSFDRSPLDGFAIRAEDSIGVSKESSIELKIIDNIPAGYYSLKKVETKTAMKIMTGAPIPKGANAIVRFEDTIFTNDTVTINSPKKPAENICKAGEDIKRGELLLTKCRTLTPAAIALLVAIGRTEVKVYRKPRIAILSTGDELLDINDEFTLGKIKNSNQYLLAALIQDLGGEPILLGIVEDELDKTVQKINEGLEKADMVISTGGVSVGDYDVVKEAMERCNINQLFWKVAIKPGTPVVAGIREDKLFFGLSGNPAGASIIFELLIKPVIKKMTGSKDILPRKITAILKDSFNKKSSMRRVLRGKLYYDSEMPVVDLNGKQNPGVLKSMLDCNALIDVPAKTEPLSSGQEVRVWIIEN